MWARTWRAGRWLHAYIRSFTEIGAHREDFVCACASAFADGDVNRHVIEAPATTDAEVLLSGCTHDQAQAVVR